ncbi:MAG: hypothetical protein JWN20_2823 [Jatrophihabitantaceae bacterium]|nr:hypothetical protein [Jatrophihabitantaceae bacterium]
MFDDVTHPETAENPDTAGPAEGGLFSRTLAWARSRQWIATTEDDEDGHAGQALLEVPDDHAARESWPTAIEMPIVLFVPDDGQRVAIYCLIVEGIEHRLRPAVTELITRANRGLLGGAFEVDVDEGDVRFRSDLDLGGAEVDDEQLGAMLAPLLEVNLETVEVYSSAIVSVLTGRATPLDAVEAAEDAQDAQDA